VPQLNKYLNILSTFVSDLAVTNTVTNLTITNTDKLLLADDRGLLAFLLECCCFFIAAEYVAAVQPAETAETADSAP
jgi:hypothetical protein